MNFSTRTFNILSRNDIKDLWDLSHTTKEQLKEMKNMGKMSMIEIVDKACEYGVVLDDR
jgi:DNA-directed RNA polymerase alpha subunit